MSGETVLGRDSDGRVREYQLATQEELDAGGGGPAATPTLAEVLAAGADAGETRTISTALSLGIEGASVADGNAPYVQVYGGASGSNNPAGIEVYGGSDAGDGKPSIFTDGTYGNAGDALTSDGTYATWGAIVTTAAETPVGGGLTSPLVADTTGKKLYAWIGSDYVQIGEWT